MRKCKAYREHERSHQIHKRSFLARKREHLQAEVATLQKEVPSHHGKDTQRGCTDHSWTQTGPGMQDEHAFNLLSRAEELAKLAAVEVRPVARLTEVQVTCKATFSQRPTDCAHNI